MSRGTIGCKMPDCERKHKAWGFCNTHYERLRKHGSPTAMDPRRGPVAARFWPKVKKTESCWIWTAYLNAQGYGQLAVSRGNLQLAHRVAYELIVGAIPDGLVLDHLCRVRNCVNPGHLEPVTQAENMRRGMIATKTHCKWGHLLSGENLYRAPNGNRRCRQCARTAELTRRAPARTHCRNGHPLEGDNVIASPDARRCRTCRRNASRRFDLKQRELAGSVGR